MSELLILVVEDDAPVRESLVRDLAPFEKVFRIEDAEDVKIARQVVGDCAKEGHRLALVLCDHLMPGVLGVDYLVELKNDPGTAAARKVLVTGQAGLQDTIKAVNDAGLDHYIAKPWTRLGLHACVIQQLTDYVIDEEEDLLPFVRILDAERLMNAIKQRDAKE
jgi:CheY-like chemotaxis protein